VIFQGVFLGLAIYDREDLLAEFLAPVRQVGHPVSFYFFSFGLFFGLLPLSTWKFRRLDGVAFDWMDW
jgi:hypothetical protein